jgi:hypothetical protein
MAAKPVQDTMFGMKTPDVTPTQVMAMITFVVTQIVAFGWIDNDAAEIVLSGAGTILPVAFVFVDMLLRKNRAQALAEVRKAELLARQELGV